MPNMFYIPKVKKTKDGLRFKIQTWKSPSTIDRANRKIARLAKLGKAFPSRIEKDSITVLVPCENAVYQFNLNEQGFIKNINRF